MSVKPEIIVSEQFQERMRESGDMDCMSDCADKIIALELQHRMRNMMSVINFVAREIGNSVTTILEFNDKFAQRLQGLAVTHELLTNDDKLPVLDLVSQHVKNILHDNPKVSIFGQNLILTSQASRLLGMALFELATNSVKHGAMSLGTGNIKISWFIAENTGDFIFQWIENGSEDNIVDQKGFGHVVLEGAIPKALNGEAKLAVNPVGISWFLRAPIENMIEVTKQ